MKKSLFVVALFIVGFNAFAVLPPFYQSKKEIHALLDDEMLHEKLGSGQPILDIIRTRTGWTVITPKYQLKVKVNYHKQEMVGPAVFDFEYTDLIEKTN